MGAELRENTLAIWNEVWEKGLGFAPGRKLLINLTPAHIVWRAQPERRTIWQIVDHMIYWRDVVARRSSGAAIDTSQHAIYNYRATPPPSEAMLDDLARRYHASHEQMRDAIASPETDVAQLQHLAFHDCYHIGQVMTLRALQGLPAIE